MHMAKEAKRIVIGLAGAATGVLFVALASIFGLSTDLSFQAICALGILVCCIIWWVANIFPEFVTALIMCIAFIGLCQVPTTTVFSAFASSTWWLLVAAFALGFGMQRSGLMARMAARILRVFPRTFKMQTAGLIATGTLIGPFIPSLSAKATMLAPLSLSISDAMGYERRSRQATGLFLAMFTGIRTVGPAVISASIIGYGLLATLPSDVAAQFDMLHWFACMLPWFIFVMAANYLALVLLFGDKQAKGSPLDASAEESLATKTASSIGPMTRQERAMAVIMVLCIVLWITEPLHAIPSHIVAISAMVLMLVFGVVGVKDLRQGISWESLIFIGCVLGLAEVFAKLGIDSWIIGSCEAAFSLLANNAYLLVIGICLMTILLRFIIVSEMAYINIFMAFIVPLAISFGISPWVIGVCVYAVVNPWFALYQNPIYLSAYYATEGKMANQAQSAAYCALYLAICICGLLISTPLWQALGLI